MYTFNDHAGYGVLEVVQNMVLDFVEAGDDWKEQWAICEVLPLFFTSGAADEMLMIEADAVEDANAILRRMFLAMLAILESQDLLKPNSEVKNLALVMAMHYKTMGALQEDYVKDGDSAEEMIDNYKFQSYILAYAEKHQIELHGPSSIGSLIKDLKEKQKEEEEDLSLPTETSDPWKWTLAYQKYAETYGQPMQMKDGIGGDSLDITTWSSAERKKYSFNGKDPLGKKQIDLIKQGEIIQLG